MKFVYYLLHLFFIMLFCNTVFAVVTDEEFETLNKRVKSMEKTMRRLEQYLDKADSIESEITRSSSETKLTQIQDDSSQEQKSVAGFEGRVDKKIKRLEDVVYELKDRAALLDMTEEIRRVQEFVCRN